MASPYLMFPGGPKEEGREPPGRKQLMSLGGGEREAAAAHLPRALLAASEGVTYNGVVCMRKKAFLPLDVLQWELKVSEKSRFKLVPVGVRSGA